MKVSELYDYLLTVDENGKPYSFVEKKPGFFERLFGRR